MTWIVLALWWVVLPAAPGVAWLHWFAHLATAGIVGLLVARRVWGEARVRPSPPVVATLLAVLSLAVAVRVAPHRFPLEARWWAGLTGVAHAVLFLAAWAWAPARRADEARAEDGEPDDVAVFRRAFTVVLAGLLVAQALVVWRDAGAVERVEGGFGNPNTFGAVVAACGLALAAFGCWRRTALVALVPCAALVLATRSRGAAAAAAVTVLVLAARRDWRRVVALGALLVVALVVVPNPLWERVTAMRTEHFYSRPFLWQAALEGAAEEPLGIGPGMNLHEFPKRALDRSVPWLVHQRFAVGLTHNVFTTLTLEWGWLAGAAAVGLALWALARLWPRGPVDPLAQGATLGALVLFLELQIDGLEQNAVAFSLFLVFAAVALRRVAGAGRGPALSGRLVGATLAATCVLLLVQDGLRARRVSVMRDAQAVWDRYQLGRAGEDAVEAAVARAEEVAPREENVAVARFSFEALAHRRAVRRGAPPAELAEREARAWAAADVALARQPADRDTARLVADFAHRLLPREGAAPDDAAFVRYVHAVRTVLERDPLDVVSRRELAGELARAGDLARAEEEFDALLAVEPHDAAAWALRARWRLAAGDLEGALHASVRARECVFDCRILTAVGAPRSHAFYEDVLDKVDLAALRRRIAELRRELYL